MKRSNIDRAWDFVPHRDSVLAKAFGMGNAQPRTVNLPHDITIEKDVSPDAPGRSLTGYFVGGKGTYTKMLDIPEQWRGQRVIVEFDGSYMNTEVELNGQLVMRQHYGYSPFHADLTPYIKYGQKNRLSVYVNNDAQPSSRWYSGSGLYRHVDLLTAPAIHIAPWGVFAYTTHVTDGTAFVTVQVEVENHTADKKQLRAAVMLTREGDSEASASDCNVVVVAAHGKATARVKLNVPNAALWDIDSPNLYSLSAALMDGDETLDCDTSLFGIRTVSVDAVNGFMLNGRTVNLKGGCVHHDNGILGAVSLYDAEYRKFKLHKDNGYNAIRCAHNPPSRDMLEACDRLGLVVIDEAFDVWTMGKSDFDYSMYFVTDWEKDMEAFIRRDRNHPCVAIWSTGNEVTERAGLADGYEWAKKLAAKVREIDPTRPVTNALCSFFNGLDDDETLRFFSSIREEVAKNGGSFQNFDSPYGREIWDKLSTPFAAPLDIVGYNYLAYRYEPDGKAHPNRVICGTETKAPEVDIHWDLVERLPHVIGDFLWTSHDHLGEAGLGRIAYLDPDVTEGDTLSMRMPPFPWRTSFGSDFDLCGNERPQLPYHRIVWGSDETYIAAFDPANTGKKEWHSGWGWAGEHSWNFPDSIGKPTKVEIYSAADEVELLLNGQSLGRKPSGKTTRYKAVFELNYEPGKLEAVSYSNGKEVSRGVLETTGTPAALRVTLDKTSLTADGQSLAFAAIDILDANGRVVSDGDLPATAKVDGAATLAAFGSANPTATENYTKGEFTSFNGRLLAVVRAGYDTGSAVLTVSAGSLEPITVNIEII